MLPVQVVVVLVVTDSGGVVRTSDYLFDSFCCHFEAWAVSFTHNRIIRLVEYSITPTVLKCAA